ncbi:Clan MA, family M3, oligopeptidase A-like metallopeptidase [Trichomonas vaginalis G3]|uniref:oligopeptidase A n=1 Tax=Trichomonas vaginalis (strain ATCC PRA-98 / G3) TaxID=412133 RepID=A2DAE1_TRIV3|nr:Clan MA, family M3, oligopeptidase A-like metallopeptidase [Trichomonas vaginalis G3]EAY22789.1 Clan MA, family M3, oligopeptidase A-like metallopeptidase [Trichomonas vaginalis G3]KAI5525600.1 Clan MA, family M3, oligopeptidase A-like metallopeptidase [Trichomonas vaginalis G3]|eukprot:XP_001583775.1 Clan MA, family M3, oligopeptidase A-like metallopeptidase [Trichomonas vaginalis G3]
MSSHPFLDESYYPKWSTMTPDHVFDDGKYAIDLANKAIDEISQLPDDQITYDNTFRRFDKLFAAVNTFSNRVSHLIAVKETTELREAYAKILPVLSEFETSVYLNDKLYKVLSKEQEKSKEQNLNKQELRFIDNTIKEFQQNGAGLSEDKKKRISEISVELSTLTKKFSDNVLDSTKAGEIYVTNPDDLKGLPQSAIDAAKEDATNKGQPDKWRFNLQYPSRLPVMMHADSEELRKKMYDLNLTIGRGGQYDNGELVKKITALRDEKAKLLGFKTWADLVLNRRMAENGSNALKFVEDLHDKCYSQYMEDNEALLKYAKSKNPDVVLKPWNTAYWAERQRVELYDFDEEKLKPYFPAEKVLEGLYQIVQRIYGIDVKEVPTYVREKDAPEVEGKVEVWHPDVKVFEVFDSNTHLKFGAFYVDLYPREDKHSGGWMSELHIGHPSANDPNLSTLNCNLNKSIGGKPALLSHDDVSTIFHEFGHNLHCLFYDGEISSLSGMSVPWDYVELPSQFHENYVWEREALDLFAKHWETGEKIPDDLFNKMIAARNYRSATFFVRQLYFGRIDFALHQEYEKYKDMDLDAIDDVVADKYRSFYGEKTHTMYYNFSHLFSSPVAYSAGYYSYKWAEVLDADCFSRFQKEGIFNKETGMSFRREILEKGNSIPVQEEFRNFMGRDPSQEALLKRSGIKY